MRSWFTIICRLTRPVGTRQMASLTIWMFMTINCRARDRTPPTRGEKTPGLTPINPKWNLRKSNSAVSLIPNRTTLSTLCQALWSAPPRTRSLGSTQYARAIIFRRPNLTITTIYDSGIALRTISLSGKDTLRHSKISIIEVRTKFWGTSKTGSAILIAMITRAWILMIWNSKI